MPDVIKIDYIEPWIKATIFVPDDYLGPVLTLCTEARWRISDLRGQPGRLVYRLP